MSTSAHTGARVAANASATIRAAPGIATQIRILAHKEWPCGTAESAVIMGAPHE